MRFSVDGTLTFTYSMWNVWQAGSQGALIVTAIAGSHMLIFDFPNFRFYDMDPQVSGNGLVKAKFTGGAMYQATSGVSGQITLVACNPYF